MAQWFISVWKSHLTEFRAQRFDYAESKNNLNQRLQLALLRLYAGVHATGLLSGRPGNWVFERLYYFYKDNLEASFVDHLRPLVTPGSTVIDVGANIGFFTRRFARWTSREGKVIALEPEAENFRRLNDALARDGTAPQVEAIQAAVGAATGTAMLQLHPFHPGDHRIVDGSGSNAVTVPLTCLDELLAVRGWPKVSLVKIDVQGAEERVLEGADRTLTEMRPAWFVEVDDACLRGFGSSAAALLTRFVEHGYHIHRLNRDGVGNALDTVEILEHQSRSGEYEDLLFLPSP